MADITLEDLLHWQRGLHYRPPAGVLPDEGMERLVSWAVTLRATAPVLPPLRGGEIVVAPPRILAQIETTETISRADLLRTLAGQPVAALMVDPTFAEGQVEGVPLLVASGVFPHDAEATLNRLITERRGELYRRGSDLSRALSTATLSGASLDDLLDAIEGVVQRPLVLLNQQGLSIAESRGAGPLTFPTSLVDTGTVWATRARDVAGKDWLVQPISSSGRPGAMALLIGLAPDASSEMERLAIAQSAGAVELILSQAVDGALSSRERSSREPLVADLLLGRIPDRNSADARARLVGLDPSEPARLSLFRSAHPDLPGRVRQALPDERGRAGATLNDQEYAVISTGEAHLQTTIRDLTAALRTVRRDDTSAVLTISEPVPLTALGSRALSQVRLLANLVDTGAIAGPTAQADTSDQLGLYGLLMPLMVGDEIDPLAIRGRLAGFATKLLGPLEAHDRKRDSDLVRTLAVWLDAGAATAQAADTLNVHRNTLSYRLRQIAELTRRNLGDPQVRFLFQLALGVRAMERATEG
jgi:purine catabolism regulator